MASRRELRTTITIDGELAKSLDKAIKSAQRQLDALEQAADGSGDAFTNLNRIIGAQGDELKKAKRDYANYVLSGEESSDAAQELADKIRRLSREMRDNEDAIKQAWKAADDLGDAARDTGDGFTVMKGAAASLVADGIQAIISKCAEAVSSLLGLADSTREFRQDMATLTTAYDQAGFSAEQAEDTWKDLYAVFGEDDRAVEAANNIARMADSQAELDEWARITTGVWGTYQDALPVESLAEAAGETAKTGTVTGALADALNWSSEAAEMFAGYMSEDVTTAEDAFNEALAACSTEAERQALITETLTKLYGDAADTYEETAGSLMDANKANADYNMTLADMGELIEPVTTAGKAGLTGLLGVALDLMSRADLAGFAEDVSAGFAGLTEFITPLIDSVLPSLGNMFSTVLTAFEPIVPLIGDFASSVLPVLIDAISTVFSVASPIIPIMAELVGNLLPVITALVDALTPVVNAVFTALTPVLDAISDLVSQLIPPLISVINVLTPVISFLAGVITGTLSSALQSLQPIISNVIGIFSGLIDFISNIFAGNWEAAWQSVVDIFSNIIQLIVSPFRAAINAIISIANGILSGLNNLSFDLPEILGGGHVGFDIPLIPLLATGGFTEGPSIAGEAGVEAVISFDRSVREANLGYWAQAGRMLNATPEDAGFTLSGDSGGDTYIDMGGVTFAPNIEINGPADKQSVIDAIEEEYPEFLDLLEDWFSKRGVTVYGN